MEKRTKDDREAGMEHLEWTTTTVYTSGIFFIFINFLNF